MSRLPARARRAGVLLEVVLSIAIFAVAASVIVRLSREALSAVDRAGDRQAAVDLARSALAELETGLRTIADFRGEGRGEASGEHRFATEVSTDRSSHPGLTLVTVRVRRVDAEPDSAPLCTLRQLVRLGADRGGEEADAGS